MVVDPDIGLRQSVTKIDPSAAGRVLVSGSHGGLFAANLAARGRLRAVIFNDAGIGKERAGIAGIAHLDDLGMAAARSAMTRRASGTPGTCGGRSRARRRGMDLKVARPEGHGSKAIPELMVSAGRAAGFLKALASEKRHLLLCLLAEAEKTVSELESVLNLEQSTVSQQLARLRADNLVTFRREAKMIRYSLASDEARRTIALLYDLFCASKIETAKDRAARRR